MTNNRHSRLSNSVSNTLNCGGSEYLLSNQILSSYGTIY